MLKLLRQIEYTSTMDRILYLKLVLFLLVINGWVLQVNGAEKQKNKPKPTLTKPAKIPTRTVPVVKPVPPLAASVATATAPSPKPIPTFNTQQTINPAAVTIIVGKNMIPALAISPTEVIAAFEQLDVINNTTFEYHIMTNNTYVNASLVGINLQHNLALLKTKSPINSFLSKEKLRTQFLRRNEKIYKAQLTTNSFQSFNEGYFINSLDSESSQIQIQTNDSKIVKKGDVITLFYNDYGFLVGFNFFTSENHDYKETSLIMYNASLIINLMNMKKTPYGDLNELLKDIYNQSQSHLKSKLTEFDSEMICTPQIMEKNIYDFKELDSVDLKSCQMPRKTYISKKQHISFISKNIYKFYLKKDWPAWKMKTRDMIKLIGREFSSQIEKNRATSNNNHPIYCNNKFTTQTNHPLYYVQYCTYSSDLTSDLNTTYINILFQSKPNEIQSHQIVLDAVNLDNTQKILQATFSRLTQRE